MQVMTIRLRLQRSPAGRDQHQAGSVAGLGHDSHHVRREVADAEIAAYHPEERLVVVDVGDGKPCHYGHQQYDAARYAAVLPEFIHEKALIRFPFPDLPVRARIL